MAAFRVQLELPGPAQFWMGSPGHGGGECTESLSSTLTAQFAPLRKLFHRPKFPPSLTVSLWAFLLDQVLAG